MEHRTPAPIENASLAVEIVSPTSHFRDMHAKTKVYAAAGVGAYWVVDPTFDHGVVLTEFRLGAAGDYDIVVSTSQIFETDVPYPVKIDLPALTALRNEYAEATKGL